MYDELITALRTCVDKDTNCPECPYYERCMNNTSGQLVAMVDAADAIEELSKDRPTGRWVYRPEFGFEETWTCSECGEKTTSGPMGVPRYEFCPNCGAKMMGGGQDDGTA